MELTLASSVQYLPRVGPRMAGLLRKLGVETVYDLLTYIPFRYNDYSRVMPLRAARPGEIVTVVGTLEYIKTFTTKNGKRLVMARLRDESGTLEVIWFNQTYLVKILKPGMRLSASGKVDWFGQKLVLSSPEYEVLEEEANGQKSLHTGRLVPVYPETEGLTSKWLRGRIAYALKEYLLSVADPLTEELRQEHNLIGITQAIQTAHFPHTPEEAAQAKRRLSFDELFTLHLRVARLRRVRIHELKSRPFPVRGETLDRFISSLPFTLTPDQQTCTTEIITDLSRDIPMNRLLEGDVGAGKTVLAAIAMYAVHAHKSRSVLMAPTQILAQQHYETLTALMSPHGIGVELVVGGGKQKTENKKKKTEKSKTRKKIHNVQPDVFVGTHALLSENVPIPQLGLVVIDEQQRFGVDQRSMLRKKDPGALTPHLLTMTATPIPRTIAQTVFGNLDISVLTTLPSGRKPVKTWVVPNHKRDSAYVWIRKQLLESGSQAFIVCPLIDESESMASVKAATTEYERLKGVFVDMRLGLLHGRLKPKEKTQMLEAFRSGEFDVLVSTPVVEVGIDIPNATVMLIEAAERFGLSQLHQLRGRVGRGEKGSYCLLFTEKEEDAVISRLKALETVHNGPELAELDFALRGPGDVFGTRQHGLPGLKLATLSDRSLVGETKEAAGKVFTDDPELTKFPLLREKLEIGTIDAQQD